MASDQQKALKHIRTIIDGLKEQEHHLLERLAASDDINDALEIRHRLDKVQLKQVAAYAVRRHLEAAVAVSPPSAEMVDKVDDLLARMAIFEWQSAKIIKVISTARTLTRGFGRQTTLAEKLA